jgi:hypothetical protein
MTHSKRGFSNSGSFKRITITRNETVIRKGTADVWVPDGLSFAREDGCDDTQNLADLLDVRNAIEWEHVGHMEDYIVDAEIEEEDLPQEDQDAAVRCSRDEDLNWVVLDKGVR